MPDPLISIGMTTYNAQDTIESAVKSALKQDYPAFEIVIVDDCSQDDTLHILQELEKQHDKIRLFQNDKNLGVAGTRNHIIAESKGEFIAFFDDDDNSLPHRLRTQLNRILDCEKQAGDNSLVICHSARRLIFSDTQEIIADTMASGPEDKVHGLAVAEKIILGFPLEKAQGACPTCSQMARLSTYETLCGFDPAFRRSEDTDLNVRLARAGGYFVGIAEPLVIQKMTDGQDKGGDKEYIYQQMLLDKHRELADAHGMYGFCHKWILLKHDWLLRRRGSFIIKLLTILLRHPFASCKRFFPALRTFKVNRFYKNIYRHE